MDIQQKPQGRAWVSWLLVVLWVTMIYLTIPLARTIQEFIRDHGAQSVFLWITYLSFGLAAAWLIRGICTGMLSIPPGRLLVLALVLGVFCWQAWTLRRHPEEAIHFVQYGGLAILIFRAFSHRLTDSTIYVATAFLGFAFGITDELIQWITPRRYFDYRDIGINNTAVALVVVGFAAGIRPAYVHRYWSAIGLRISFNLLSLNTLLLLFCLMNTPSMKEWYTRYIPAAGRIPHVTAEYGYRYENPEIGIFFSRLDPAALQVQDRERAVEIAPRLQEVRTDKEYDAFINRISPHHDPLLVETRVRLFRRDRYATMSRRTSDDQERIRTAIIAHNENEILELYTPHTLLASGYKWPEELRRHFAVLAENAPPYRSPVSQNLITRVSRLSMLVLLTVVWLASMAGERWAARKHRYETAS